MNYKVLKRPMFRIGGGVDSQGTGITSGMDTPRQNFKLGTLGELTTEREKLYGEAVSGYEKLRGQLGPLALLKMASTGAFQNVGSLLDIPQAIGSPEALGATMEGLSSMPKVDLGISKLKLGKVEGDIETRLAINKANQKKYELQERLNTFRANNEKLDQMEQVAGGLEELKKNPAAYRVYKRIEDENNFIFRAMSELSYVLSGMLKFGEDADIEDLMEQYQEAKTKVRGAQGGIIRKNYQEGVGPNIMEQGAAVMDQGATVQPAAVQQQPEQQDPYQILRQRLPAEVPDEIVRLIAYNKEAFQDFANIQTQDDITAFNDKYGVSLVIDVGSV